MAGPFRKASQGSRDQKIRDGDAPGENRRGAEAEIVGPDHIERLRVKRVGQDMFRLAQVERIVNRKGRVQEGQQEQRRKQHGGPGTAQGIAQPRLRVGLASSHSV